jgi:predicted extracellular nuclease
MLRIANFNVENLFSRFTILNLEGKEREKANIDWENLSLTNKVRKGQTLVQLKREPIHEVAQENTAKIIDLVNADVICMQEVEGLPTLRDFSEKILKPIQKKNGNKPYTYFMCIDGNDPRGIDVAVMSRYQLGNIKTHMFEPDPQTKKLLFSRDCLEIEVLTNEKLHFLVNHFKSQITSTKGDTNGINKRTRQANKVTEIVKELLQDDSTANIVVTGDLNETPNGISLKSLLSASSDLYNTIKEKKSEEQWTYVHGSKKQQLDYILVSDNLKSKIKNVGIERQGLSKSKTAYKGKRLDTVDKDGTEASDHCAIYVDLNI